MLYLGSQIPYTLHVLRYADVLGTLGQAGIARDAGVRPRAFLLLLVELEESLALAMEAGIDPDRIVNIQKR